MDSEASERNCSGQLIQAVRGGDRAALLGPAAFTACSAVCFYAWTDCAQDAQDAYDRCIENCKDYGDIC